MATEKSTRERTILALVLMISAAVAACGGSPTAPSKPLNQAPTAVIVQTSTPVPEPVPDPPTPSDPTPPAPAPAPAPPVPVPAPKPAPDAYLDASTDAAHWYDPAHALASTFVIELWPDAVWLDMLRLDRVPMPDGSIIAVTPDRSATFTMQRGDGHWTWTFNGLSGQANGAAVQR